VASVPLDVVSGGGHQASVWRAALQPMLDWMTTSQTNLEQQYLANQRRLALYAQQVLEKEHKLRHPLTSPSKVLGPPLSGETTTPFLNTAPRSRPGHSPWVSRVPSQNGLGPRAGRRQGAVPTRSLVVGH
jgi:hypothetical protein